MSVFSEYYKQELRVLRERAVEFASDHPSLAGLLEGPSTDPDVERLLEGVAFLSADIRRTLDQDFGEILHALAQSVCPHLVRPIPSATVIAFTPKPNLKQTIVVAAGTQLDSIPVEEQVCRFTTCMDTPVAPLRLAAVDRPDLQRQTPAADGMLQLRLAFESLGIGLENVRLPRLRLYLSGEFADTADLYMLLTHYLRSVQVVERASGRIVELPATAVRPVGFERDEALLPRPSQILPAYGVLQDYFLFAEKFLFLDIDLERWQERGNGNRFDLIFNCAPPPFPLPEIGSERFVLHAVPAVNLFQWEAEPVVLDQRDSEYLLRPAGQEGSTYTIFSVDRVEGISRGAEGRRLYQPFSSFMAGKRTEPAYQVMQRPSRGGDGTDVYLAVALPPEQPLIHREVLKATLTCSNGEHAEALLPHDITTPTRNTPELVTFTNLSAPTPARRPSLGESKLWHLIAHLSLNYLSIAQVENLQALLRHYAIPGGEERGRDLANLKRIESLSAVEVSADERLLGDTFVRGQAIRIRLRQDHFASHGDRYLFGAVLNHFFASCSPLNSYTALTLEDSVSGERLEWPPMLGTRPLM